jgi:hypothetical protein
MGLRSALQLFSDSIPGISCAQNRVPVLRNPQRVETAGFSALFYLSSFTAPHYLVQNDSKVMRGTLRWTIELYHVVRVLCQETTVGVDSGSSRHRLQASSANQIEKG